MDILLFVALFLTLCILTFLSCALGAARLSFRAVYQLKASETKLLVGAEADLSHFVCVSYEMVENSPLSKRTFIP